MSTIAMPEPTAKASPEFENLFREHYALVYRTARVITGSADDAKDVLQTIFLRLLQRAVPPDAHKNPKGYFYRAAVNASLDMLRSRRREVLVDDFTLIEANRRISNLSETSTAQDTINQRLRETLTTLPPRTVEILTLRYVHDYPEAEIAKLLGRSRGTVAVTLFRARRRLRKLLGENR
jgi:RNA polymerase sigma-70 factor (ECF subfamily)